MTCVHTHAHTIFFSGYKGSSNACQGAASVIHKRSLIHTDTAMPGPTPVENSERKAQGQPIPRNLQDRTKRLRHRTQVLRARVFHAALSTQRRAGRDLKCPPGSGDPARVPAGVHSPWNVKGCKKKNETCKESAFQGETAHCDTGRTHGRPGLRGASHSAGGRKLHGEMNSGSAGKALGCWENNGLFLRSPLLHSASLCG